VRPVGDRSLHCPVSYVWETGDLFLETRTALEQNTVVTLEPYQAERALR
jgi:hypothetical protein